MYEQSNTKSLLKLRGVTKRFGGFTAVDGVSFELEKGVIGGLIGPNGAGKTSLFNTLAGLLIPDEGEIFLDGVPLHNLPPHKTFWAGLARTFQIPRPFPEMTILENVMTVREGQAGEIFWNNWFRHANTLSGGQMKLLELARVLMADPKIILLDEPAAGVNPSLMMTLVDKIEALNERGHTFLIIEHNMDVVMSICDPIMVMAQGKLIYKGDVDGARQNPQVLDAYLGDLP